MATVQNVVVNELLCFLSNKVRSMTYESLMKLCMDFYDEETVIAAKTILLEHVVIPEADDKRKRRIGPNKKVTSMKDILSVFLELTLDDVPLFVANNLRNLPPLSMDNFDMSRVIHDMEIIKLQMKVLQEAQETSLAAHVAICHERSRDIDAGASPTHSTGTPPTPTVAHTPLGDPVTTPGQDEEQDQGQTTNTLREHRRIDENGGDDEDLERLARIQGRLSFTPPHQPLDRRTNNNGNRNNGNNQHEINQNSVIATQYVWSGRLNTTDSHRRGNSNNEPNMNHHANPNRFNNPRGNHGNHSNRRQARDSNSIITGTSTSSSLSAATPRGNPRQSRKDGLFVSRLSRNTRASDVMNYIRTEANLNIRCDPIATRYDTYRSYYIHAAPRHHALLLKPGMWPRDVLVKKYNPK